ncbi:polysaccharide deacetylase family protein [Haloarcula sp. GH36]|uniref:polysaccharide deacetylase family protein n=1 Tax=Haloarcula montana TaxID=3111776 RepID=UPI002D79D907|nr:polysaccharide deacetylase family protein [Haloarcula sp. GH36]
MDKQPSQSLTSVEFTYDWYRSFLDRLADLGYEFRTFSDGAGHGEVLLRHDIDLSIENALTTARIEAERGIEATYCVLVTSALYNPLEGKRRDQLRAIEALGHEVALHTSTHEYWDSEQPPDDSLLESWVERERDVLATVLSERPETVSFHVPPSWVLDRPFDGFTNTYAPALFSDIDYIADSGQRWRTEPPELPDASHPIQILTHPGLWGESDAEFEDRIEQSISIACQHTTRKARREFVEDSYNK